MVANMEQLDNHHFWSLVFAWLCICKSWPISFGWQLCHLHDYCLAWWQRFFWKGCLILIVAILDFTNHLTNTPKMLQLLLQLLPNKLFSSFPGNNFGCWKTPWSNWMANKRTTKWRRTSWDVDDFTKSRWSYLIQKYSISNVHIGKTICYAFLVGRTYKPWKDPTLFEIKTKIIEF